MKIWIYLDGRQQGPFEFAQLPIDRMDPKTPVWYEGLDNWMAAGQAPATADLFSDFQHPQPHDVVTEVEVEVEAPSDQPVDDQPAFDNQPSSTGFQPVSDQPVSDQPVSDQPVSDQSASDQGARSYAAAAARQAQEPCPPSYLVWSILLTVLCCNPIGIVAIVLGLNVGSKYRNYNYEGARRASEATAWWLMITIVTSLMSLPLSMLSML